MGDAFIVQYGESEQKEGNKNIATQYVTPAGPVCSIDKFYESVHSIYSLYGIGYTSARM
jgi:hypothetical protein